MISNHQSWSDILVLQDTFLRRIPPLKFFVKRQLIWIPLLGLAMWLLGFPYVRRYSREALANDPSLRRHDQDATQRASEFFKQRPTSVLNFMEGTRFTPEKHTYQQSKYRNLLMPKTGGFGYVVAALGERVDQVLDVTIVYPNGAPSFWEFISGQCRDVRVEIAGRPVPPELFEVHEELPDNVRDTLADVGRHVVDAQGPAHRGIAQAELTMYDDYYRFKQKPFSIAPDPAFLYLSERHREALAHLMYGLRTDGGFVLITGEVGTGKTTLIRSLIDEVPDDLDVAFVLNPRLTVNELLETLCEELGIPERGDAATTNKHLIDRLNKHLLRTHALGRSTVVIIDEAQNLSPAVLEQIRLLTNLETNERKLVRIILLGQPELAEMLDRREMRQLVQRVTARYHLAALTREDARAYIAHRLSLAGGNPHLFTRGAAHEAYRLSHGIPRLINVIADRALLGTYVEGRPRVTARIVRKAAHEAFGQQTWLRPHLWVGAVAASALVVAGAWALWDRNPQWRPPQANISQAAPQPEP